MSEPDGVDKVVGGGLRVALTAAGLVAEHLARARAERMRRETAESTASARELAARLVAERAAARAQLAVVDRREWWDNAQARDVADAWETAQLWRQVEPEAERAVATIVREVRDRYGVDLEDRSPVDRDALEQAVRERQTAAVERRRAQGSGAVLEASLVRAADEANRAAGIVDESAQAELAAELADIERPIDLAHMVVEGLRRGAETDVAVQRAEVERATTAASAAESAADRLEAQATPANSAPAGDGAAAGQAATTVQTVPDEAARRAALVKSGSSSAAPARAVADRLNAKPVTAAPAAGKAALRAPKPRKTVDRTNERAQGR
ncbi:hypothetical protein [Modestobacter sp. SSW1-42]|uniref:hypothetical protein n=1 Tax=Modestobacter sp. SSW1-42 TaxID=596372 RepID=UPI003986887D